MELYFSCLISGLFDVVGWMGFNSVFIFLMLIFRIENI